MSRALVSARRWLLIVGLVASMTLGARSQQDNDPLVRGFRNPPDSAKPHTWWHWLNGNSSKVGITADLEAMKKAGIGGVQIFNVDCGIPDGPVPVMSDEWLEHTRHAIAEAARLGLEVCVHNCPGWSSSGGPWVKPEHAMQMLTWSEVQVQGPAAFSDVLPQPPTRMNYYRDIAVFAIPHMSGPSSTYRIRNIGPKSGFDRPPMRDPDLVPDAPPGVPATSIVWLTHAMDAEGRLRWQVPEGSWTIIRMGHTCTGAVNAPAPATGRGLEVDKLSREAMDAFWPGFMGQVIRVAGPHAGRVLNNALIDSYETGYQNWTPRFREEFRKLRGYDPLPYLPVVTGRIVDNIEVSERFLWDFRRTISDLWAANYYGYFAELCHRYGLKLSVEPYGNGNFDNLQAGGLADIPMGEFWVPNAGSSETLKLAASAAHTYGRTIVGAESFTTDEARGRWLVEPYGIKALGDYVFTLGINRYIFHRYAHQPWLDLYPGMTMGPWGMHLERTVTWWNQAHAWFRYIARCQYLLQSGKFVADVCYFIGEARPNDLPGRSALQPPIPAGYDYDGCDAEVLLKRMSVRDGHIMLPDGMRYRVLVLPFSKFMTPEVARKVRELVRAGAIVIGPKPEKSPSLENYPACDQVVAAIGQEVWGDCDGVTRKERSYGKGRVFWGVTLQEVFRILRLPPDFQYRPVGDARIVYIHRRAGNADIYFVSNQQYRTVNVDCTFRVAGKEPELWHPDTGRIQPAPVWRVEQGRTVVSLRLDPAESVFVVFRKPPVGDTVTRVVHQGPRRVPRTEKIEVTFARYEAPDGSRGADVTERVRQLVAEGLTEIPATNEVFGDPVPLVVKRLRIEWRLNGIPKSATVDEHGVIVLSPSGRVPVPPPWSLTRGANGHVLVPWQSGTYELRTAAGKTKRLTVRTGATELPVTGPWTVHFDPRWGGPLQTSFNKLISWSEHENEGIRYYSGSAVYVREFQVPAGVVAPGREVVLDLGTVKNFAEVTLNGRDFGVLWKAPYRLNVTGALRAGKNVLQVRVTNLWPNRLIGDEHKPPEVEWNGNALAAWPDWVWSGQTRPKSERYTFTTWRFWRKEDPLQESGLLGPVVIRSAERVPVRF